MNNSQCNDIDSSVTRAMSALYYGAQRDNLVHIFTMSYQNERLGKWIVRAAEILLEKKASVQSRH